MERKIVLEVEELEERIAPHCALGFEGFNGSAQVAWAHAHPPGPLPPGVQPGDPILGVPGQGNTGAGIVLLPDQSDAGMGQFDQQPGPGCGDPVPPGQQS